MQKANSLALSGLVFLLSAAACAESPTVPEPSAPSFASAQVSTQFFRQTIPISGLNACSGELVDGTLEATIQQRVVVNKNGVSARIWMSGHGSGTGSFGNNYQLSLRQSESSNLVGATSISDTFYLSAVSTGPSAGQNLNAKLTFKITLNANGEVATEVQNFSITCESE